MRATIGALLRKELAIELRTRESVPAMVLFTVTTYVIFHFGLDRNTVDGDLAAGVLWVTLLFAAILGINRLFVADHEQGGFDGFLLAPVDRSAMLVAKAVALLAFLCAVELVAVPAFGLLLLGPSLAQALPGLLVVLLAADVGIAVVGTLVAALAIQTRARDLMVPLLALPLLVPVVLGASKATAPLFALDGAQALPADWLSLLAHGRKVFAVGSSDSHGIVGSPVGYPRTCITLGTDDPRQVTPNLVRDQLAAGHGAVSGGIYVSAKLGDTVPGDTTTGAGSPQQVDVTVQAASWVDVAAIEVIVDGETTETIGVVPADAVPGTAVRWRGKIDVQTRATGGFVVIAAYGNQPMDLVHPGKLPFGVTEPIFVVP